MIGTRPEVIKMAPVFRALRSRHSDLDARVAFTGQHTTLVDSVMGAFELVPDFDLAIMKSDQTLYDVLTAASQGLAGVIREFRPHMLLAQGDTATVFAAALAGFIEIVTHDRAYDDDGARRAAVALFATLGEPHPVVQKHRPVFNRSLY